MGCECSSCPSYHFLGSSDHEDSYFVHEELLVAVRFQSHVAADLWGKWEKTKTVIEYKPSKKYRSKKFSSRTCRSLSGSQTGQHICWIFSSKITYICSIWRQMFLNPNHIGKKITQISLSHFHRKCIFLS